MRFDQQKENEGTSSLPFKYQNQESLETEYSEEASFWYWYWQICTNRSVDERATHAQQTFVDGDGDQGIEVGLSQLFLSSCHGHVVHDDCDTQ